VEAAEAGAAATVITIAAYAFAIRLRMPSHAFDVVYFTPRRLLRHCFSTDAIVACLIPIIDIRRYAAC